MSGNLNPIMKLMKLALKLEQEVDNSLDKPKTIGYQTNLELIHKMIKLEIIEIFTSK